jgi:hypothetical protein
LLQQRIPLSVEVGVTGPVDDVKLARQPRLAKKPMGALHGCPPLVLTDEKVGSS